MFRTEQDGSVQFFTGIDRLVPTGLYRSDGLLAHLVGLNFKTMVLVGVVSLSFIDFPSRFDAFAFVFVGNVGLQLLQCDSVLCHSFCLLFPSNFCTRNIWPHSTISSRNQVLVQVSITFANTVPRHNKLRDYEKPYHLDKKKISLLNLVSMQV